MTIDENIPKFEYTKLLNATWIRNEEEIRDGTDDTRVFDGESLNPLDNEIQMSPFLATAHLTNDPEKYFSDMALRRHLCEQVMPGIERLQIHFDNKNWDFFDNEAAAMGIDKKFNDSKDRFKTLLGMFETFGHWFMLGKLKDRVLVQNRIQMAEAKAQDAMLGFVVQQKQSGKLDKIWNEINGLRKRWGTIFSFLFPIYAVKDWNKRKQNLDNFTISQKRFEELKSFYVDCFETFCRISVLAAIVEGVNAKGRLVVPTKNSEMSFDSFELIANGKKSEILGRLAIGHLFFDYIDSNLRNGIGHHSARYEVKSDSIEYSTTNARGTESFSISYIRFCEKVVRLYAQLELVSFYVAWQKGVSEGLTGTPVKLGL